MTGGRPRRGTAALLAAAVALAGCGVPGSSDVVVLERVDESRLPAGDDSTVEPPGRGATTDPLEFARNFLAAAAGDPAQALRRQRAFGSDALQRWQPPGTVHIVDLEGRPAVNRGVADIKVNISVTHLGVLGEDGTVQPVVRRSAEYTLTLVAREGSLYVTDAPPVLLLPSEDFSRYFEQRVLYYWTVDGGHLVPDVRYVSRRDVPRGQRPTQLVRWLLRGPSPLLTPVVRALPRDADLVGNVLTANNRWTVNLTRAPAAEIGQIATQLRWTLAEGTGPVPGLTLQVDRDRVSNDDSRYLDANEAYRGQEEPARLCVLGGRVQQIDAPGAGGVTVPALPATYRGVLQAAYQQVGTHRTYAVLVRDLGRGLRTVDVATGDGNQFARPLPTGLRLRDAGQPVWIPTREVGLVPSAGVLLAVRPGARGRELVRGVPPGVTAVAVPPDGRRIAMVAAGVLWVGALVADGTTVSVVGRVRLPVSDLSGLTAVAWIEQTRLAVAGRSNRLGQMQLWGVTVDGAVQEPLMLENQGLGSAPLRPLVGAVDDPSDGSVPGDLMYEVNRLTYQRIDGEPVTVDDLLAPGAVGDRVRFPTAPFFYG
ncbi:MAG TPA: GerMN domain-containing protein [Pilimelia sp.]|nr:GerMN domain-containing protein [Pilimelia sp.]